MVRVCDAARVAKCFARESASSLGFLVFTGFVEAFSLLISDHNRLEFMESLTIFWKALRSCLYSSVLNRLKALLAILSCQVYILPSGGKQFVRLLYLFSVCFSTE